MSISNLKNCNLICPELECGNCKYKIVHGLNGRDIEFSYNLEIDDEHVIELNLGLNIDGNPANEKLHEFFPAACEYDVFEINDFNNAVQDIKSIILNGIVGLGS